MMRCFVVYSSANVSMIKSRKLGRACDITCTGERRNSRRMLEKGGSYSLIYVVGCRSGTFDRTET